MSPKKPIFLAVLLFVPALCQSQESCLWMNAATAGGVLGGAVTATVSQTNANSSNAQTANAKSSAGPTSANPSSASYSSNSMDDSDCVFARQQESVAGELRIEVRTMTEPGNEFASYAARCGAQATALKAIGNEAAACSVHSKAGTFSEQVVGRVRDRAFVISLMMDDASMTQRLLREKVRKVAEQVAGNLY